MKMLGTEAAARERIIALTVLYTGLSSREFHRQLPGICG